MNGFEGYVGVRAGEGQLIDDVVFSLLFVLLFVFSLVFHTNYHLFLKLVRDVFHVRARLSLFEDIDGNETVFRGFMIFQSLLLCAVSLFLISRSYGYIPDDQNVETSLLSIGTMFVVLFSFYGFKQFLNNLIGSIFTPPDLYRMWKTGYAAATACWGILLYLPVLCLSFVKFPLRICTFLFIFLYILYRFIIIYKTIYIFNVRGIGLLYIILYLCAQEILPLVFLYEGIMYLYNLY
jgi:hypothetical protein